MNYSAGPPTHWHLPRRGLRLLARLAVAAERHLQGTFVGAAHELQLDGAALRRLERVEQVIGTVYGLARGRHDQVALSEAGPGGRAVLGHLADEQALGVRQADGAPEPPGDVAGSYGDAKPWRHRRFPAGERIGPAPQRLVGGYGQVEALTEAVRVDPEQLPTGVEDRPARRAGQQRSGVLEAAGDPSAAGAAEGPLDAGDEPERDPQPASARVGQGEHRRPDPGGGAVRPGQRRGPAGVDVDDGQVGIDVVPGHGPLGGVPVREGDRHLIAAHVVRVGQHPSLCQHDARADAPPLPDAYHRGTGALRQLPDTCLDLVENRHRHHLQ